MLDVAWIMLGVLCVMFNFYPSDKLNQMYEADS